MSQLTTRIRTYGADCDVPSLVLEAINKTKVDMTVWLAVWVPQPADDPTGATYNRQVASVVKAIQTWGVDHVGGVTVRSAAALLAANSLLTSVFCSGRQRVPAQQRTRIGADHEDGGDENYSGWLELAQGHPSRHSRVSTFVFYSRPSSQAELPSLSLSAGSMVTTTLGAGSDYVMASE